MYSDYEVYVLNRTVLLFYPSSLVLKKCPGTFTADREQCVNMFYIYPQQTLQLWTFEETQITTSNQQQTQICFAEKYQYGFNNNKYFIFIVILIPM